MYYLMICFLTFMVWAKSAMKIITYRETEMLVIMLSLIRAALLHLWEFKGSYEIVCYIFHILCGLYGGAVVRWCVWFALVQCPNLSSIWMQCFGFFEKMIINLKSELLNCLLCVCHGNNMGQSSYFSHWF